MLKERRCRFRVLGLSATPGGKKETIQVGSPWLPLLPFVCQLQGTVCKSRASGCWSATPGAKNETSTSGGKVGAARLNDDGFNRDNVCGARFLQSQSCKRAWLVGCACGHVL